MASLVEADQGTAACIKPESNFTGPDSQRNTNSFYPHIVHVAAAEETYESISNNTQKMVPALPSLSTPTSQS